MRELLEDGRCVECTAKAGRHEHAWGKRYHPMYEGTQWEKEFPYLHCGICGMQMEYRPSKECP